MYDLARPRDEFPVLSRCIYLDSASTTQTPRRAVEAMCAADPYALADVAVVIASIGVSPAATINSNSLIAAHP